MIQLVNKVFNRFDELLYSGIKKEYDNVNEAVSEFKKAISSIRNNPQYKSFIFNTRFKLEKKNNRYTRCSFTFVDDRGKYRYFLSLYGLNKK